MTTEHKPHSRQHKELVPGQRSSENVVATPAPAPSQHSDLQRALREADYELRQPWTTSKQTMRLLARALLDLEEQLEAMDEAFREIIDVTEKWTRTMTDEERLLRIDTIAKAALSKASSPAKNPLTSGQWCKLHKCHQDDPAHPYSSECELNLREATPDEEAAVFPASEPEAS